MFSNEDFIEYWPEKAWNFNPVMNPALFVFS